MQGGCPAGCWQSCKSVLFVGPFQKSMLGGCPFHPCGRRLQTERTLQCRVSRRGFDSGYRQVWLPGFRSFQLILFRVLNLPGVLQGIGSVGSSRFRCPIAVASNRYRCWEGCITNIGCAAFPAVFADGSERLSCSGSSLFQGISATLILAERQARLTQAARTPFHRWLARAGSCPNQPSAQSERWSGSKARRPRFQRA